MKKRYIEYDILRIVACFSVIMIHCAVFDQINLYNYTSFEYQSIQTWGVISRWAVPVFVMLSGMLIIPRADEISIFQLMKHRVLRMLIVYIAWSCIYSFYNTYFLDIVYSTSKFKTFVDGCFSGETHMWYLPMLSGLYLISPILGNLVKNLNKKWACFWICGMFIFTSIIPFVELLEIKFVSTIVSSINGYMDLQFLGGWTLYFVLGYYIQNHTFSKKEVLLIYVGAIVGFVFTFFVTVPYCVLNGKPMGVLSYEYPNIVIFSMGIMVFFKEKISKIRLKQFIQDKIIFLSKLTFGIYLIHILLLKIWYAVGFNIQILSPIVSVPLISLVVFLNGAMVIFLVRKIPYLGKYIA